MTQNRNQAPLRADYVGSFLRPEYLLQARNRFDEGLLSYQELKKYEDAAITDLIYKQKAIGLKVITDGEFRRKSWHLDFMWGLQGFNRVELSHGYFFHGIETYHTSVQLTDRISGENHPFVEHFKFVKQFEDERVVAKQTIPAPAQTLTELYRRDNLKATLAVYPDEEQLIEDLAAAYRTVIADLYEAGCRNLQFDDCTWGMIVDKDYWATKTDGKVDLEALAQKYLRVNNLAIDGKPADLNITTHVCRGNYESAFAAAGGYDAIAKTLFAGEHVSAFYLEYDDERSGGFEPLRHVPADKRVVLGLITSKRPELEDAQTVKARISEAAQYVPLERLSLSPQCGFSSNERGNKLTETEQWAKIRLVQQIASDVWG